MSLTHLKITPELSEICGIHTGDKPPKENESLKYKPQIAGNIALVEWINKIKPKNPVKLSRYLIWKKWGFCPTNTSYKTRIKILKGVINPNSLCEPVA